MSLANGFYRGRSEGVFANAFLKSDAQRYTDQNKNQYIKPRERDAAQMLSDGQLAGYDLVLEVKYAKSLYEDETFLYSGAIVSLVTFPDNRLAGTFEVAANFGCPPARVSLVALRAL